MSYTDKIDVLDLIIATLREHEQTLNILADRLETILDGNPTELKLYPENDKKTERNR